MEIIYRSLFYFTFFYTIFAAPQTLDTTTTHVQNQTTTTTQPESTTAHAVTHVETAVSISNKDNVTKDNIVKIEDVKTPPIHNSNAIETHMKRLERGFMEKVIAIISNPIIHFIAIPKVNMVLRSIGTCVVNGAMDLVSYYLPTPLIPLVASAAGIVFPFEPVVMLRDRIPVTSYRRAFNSALKSFIGTFDRYKIEEFDDDPYMTMRFNRRVMNLGPNEQKK